MVPDFRTPLQNDLLWVYEGQTQFWGYVLGARSGLYTKQETLDSLAVIAAALDVRRARDWRALQDTTNDPVITARRPKGWTSWQRSEDYYNEGLLIWLEVDALIRNQTGGARSIDDFAKAFFGGNDGIFAPQPYDFDEIVRTLNGVAPYDWAGFLTKRLNEKASGAPLNGLVLGGYRLSYGDEPSTVFRDAEKRASELNLTYSLGLTIGKGGRVNNVVWDGPTFNAGLTTAAEIIAVNGRVYSDDVIKDAIKAAKGGAEPIRLIIKTGDRVRDMPVIWNGGPRYPKLEKTGVGDAGIDLLLRARP
jgi:predicted metalloprotease with PDZ domain